MRNPAELPWAALGVDVVLECTGLFTTKEKASAHIKGGAKKVIISAPGGKDVDATVVYGVNHQTLKAAHTVISNASCTTNCLAPLVKPLHDKIGVVSGLMTTVHAYTNDQVLTDVYHEDLRRARSATMSMIPTKTGAAAAVGLVLPELNGKLDGYAIRVPTINVSVVDLSFIAARDTTVDEVNAIMKAASESGPLAGVLNYNTAPLVSVDFNHDPASSTFDATLTKVSGTTGEGVELVRQRVGILEPDAGHDRRVDGRQVTDAMNPFTAHPASVGETYGEHCRFAFGFGVRMTVGGIAAMIHAVFPFLFVTTAGRARQLNARARRATRPDVRSTHRHPADRARRHRGKPRVRWRGCASGAGSPSWNRFRSPTPRRSLRATSPPAIRTTLSPMARPSPAGATSAAARAGLRARRNAGHGLA